MNVCSHFLQLFGGKRGINPDRGGAYRSMTAEEQLLAVKDLGTSKESTMALNKSFI